VYILIFKFLGSKLEEKIFWTEWQQTFPLSHDSVAVFAKMRVTEIGTGCVNIEKIASLKHLSHVTNKN
jgi:hypothetical protein